MEVVGLYLSPFLMSSFHKDALAMGIYRAQYALAMIALIGLAGCQSSGSNNLAFWKSNPFGGKTDSSTAKAQYPAKPSTQVPNPAGTNTPAANGLATNRTTAPLSPTSPVATASFTTPSGSPSGVKSVNPGASSPSYGPSAGSAAAVDPVVGPQRGYYSSSGYTAGNRAAATGVSTPAAAGVSMPAAAGSYAAMDQRASHNAVPSSAGFRSGARDYVSPATDYTASANTSAARNGAIIPRYGASADRYGTTADRTPAASDRPGASPDRYSSGGDRYDAAANPAAAGMDRYGSAPRAGSSYDPVAAAPSAASSPYGPNGAYPAAGPATGSRSGVTDPFQATNRSSPYPAAGVSGADRNSAAYANPYANPGSARPSNSGSDRTGAPNYRDYPSTDTPASPGSTGYNPPAGSYAPGSSGSGAPAGDYRPGSTGYNPPASDYRPGTTSYNPPSASPYRAPAASTASSTAVADDLPPYRPGNTSDYVPRSAASTAARDLPGSRVDSSVRPTGYDSGGTNYTR
jgi:hypothetical protein